MGKGGIYKWIAALLAAVMLVGVCPARAADGDELYTVQDSGLSSLTSTAGSWTPAFRPGNSGWYTLVLDEDEASFRLRATAQDSGETVTVNDTPVSSGGYSQLFTLAPGEKQNIRVVCTSANGANTTTYSLTAFRPAAHFEVKVSVGETPFADGSRQVKAEIFFTAGASLDALGVELRFDPSQLKIADRTSNQATSTVGLASTSDRALQDVMTVFDRPAADNAGGRFALQMALKPSYPNGSYAGGSGTAMLTVYFRLEPGGVLSDETLWAADCFYKDDRTDVQASWPGLTRWTGVPRAGHVPAVLDYEGGRVTVEPARRRYLSGETVTVTAEPGEGYTFGGWTGLPASLGSLKTEPTLTVTLGPDMDLKDLRAAFTWLDEETAGGAQLDHTAPYVGARLAAYNPPYGTMHGVGGTLGRARARTKTVTEWARDDAGALGLTALEIDDDADLWFLEEPADELLSVSDGAAPQVGDSRTFRIRDRRKSSGSAAGWSDGTFRLAATRTAGGQTICLWLCTDAARQPVALTEGDLAELADSFADSVAYLSGHFGTVRDTNGSGGLDVLLYDIWDSYTSGGSSYVGGFSSQSEFYGLMGTGDKTDLGNYGDVLHLDTWPQAESRTEPNLELIKATMAHETQHLCTYSAFGSRDDYMAAAIPTWINEGLSLTVEHALFGARESRIRKYNTSAAIRRGDGVLEWDGTTDDYAQVYALFQYLRTQAGEDADFGKAFYRSYADGEEEGFQAALTSLGLDKSVTATLRDFFLAVLLREDTGPYGFKGDTSLADLRPQMLTAAEFQALSGVASSGAVYVDGAGSFMPASDNGMEYIGISGPALPVTAGGEKLEGDPETGLTATLPGGQVTVTGAAVYRPDGSWGFPYGQLVILTAIPDWGMRFAGWVEQTAARSGPMMGNPLRVNAEEAMGLRATFEEAPPCALTITYEGPAGMGTVTVTNRLGETITDLTAIPAGETVTLTAQTNAGGVFVGWTGAVESTEPTVQVKVDGDTEVIARFSFDPAEFGLQLAAIRLLGPAGRGLLYSGKKVGFSTTEYDYELHLISTDAADVPLNAVLKCLPDQGVTAKLRQERGGTTVWSCDVPDYAGDGLTDFSQDPLPAALTTLTVPDVRDGDALIVAVTDGALTQEYRIAVERTGARDDPAGLAEFEPLGGGYYSLTVTYSNAAAESATISIPVKAGAVTLCDPGDCDDFDAGGVSGDYRTVKTRLTDTADGDGMVRLEITVDYGGGNFAPRTGTVTVAKILVKLADSAGDEWFNPQAPVAMYDTDRLDLDLLAKVKLKKPGCTVTGTFTGWDPTTEYTTEGTDYLVRLQKPDGTVAAAAADEVEVLPCGTGEDPYGVRVFRYTFEGVQPGEYVIYVKKPGHTSLRVTGLTVSNENAINVDEVLEKHKLPAPRLICGEVDGDDFVSALDANRLTDLRWYGGSVTYEPADPKTVYDLNGDGHIDAVDRFLQTDLAHYGHGPVEVAIPGEEGSS